MMCKKCGAKSESEMCFKHKPKKPLAKQSKGLKKSTLTVKPTVRVDKPNENHLFFTEIWKERLHMSEVSGVYLGKEPSSAFFHHILPKNKYPDLRLNKENIILLTLDEHANVESDIYKYGIINRLRESLINKYNL
tara:strand:- start:3064 stop:3468 length:405 start_codon:yes stop_codon:yes gene_type:complete